MGVATFGRAKAAVTRTEAKLAEETTPAAEAAPAPVPVPAPATASATPPVTALAVTDTDTDLVDDGSARRGLSSVRGLEGEWESRDAAIPHLSLVQRTSKVLEANPAWLGTFVYNKDEESLGTTLEVIVVNMRKYYEQDLEFGSGELPKRYASMDEVRAAGEVGAVKDVADVDMLVMADTPERYERCTFTDADDTGYYPVRMTVRSGNMASFVGVVIRDLAGWLKGSMESGHYTLSAVKKSNAKGTWYALVARPAGKVPEDLVNQIRLAYADDSTFSE